MWNDTFDIVIERVYSLLRTVYARIMGFACCVGRLALLAVCTMHLQLELDKSVNFFPDSALTKLRDRETTSYQ